LIMHGGLTQREADSALYMLSAERLLEEIDKGEWEVSPAVRHYRSARDTEDYLVRRNKFERRQCRRRTLSKPGEFAKSLMGRGGIVRVAIVGALTTGLTTFLVWLVVTFAP
jgi:hypothetical protein